MPVKDKKRGKGGKFKKKKKVTSISNEDIEFLVAKTNYDAVEIAEWFTGFIEDNPDGTLSKEKITTTKSKEEKRQKQVCLKILECQEEKPSSKTPQDTILVLQLQAEEEEGQEEASKPVHTRPKQATRYQHHHHPLPLFLSRET